MREWLKTAPTRDLEVIHQGLRHVIDLCFDEKETKEQYEIAESLEKDVNDILVDRERKT